MPKIIEDEQIFRATIQMVIERGYSGATTKQIAEAANISEVTLFRKYGNKAQLVAQAIEAIGRKLDFARATVYTGDVTVDLLRVVQKYRDSTQERGQFFSVLISEITRHPELAEVLDTPLTMVNRVGELLVRYQTEGVLKPEPPMHAVSSLMGPLFMNNLFHEMRSDIPFPPLDLEMHVAFFVNGRKVDSG